MGGCFGSHPIDRWLESQVDAYCGGNELRLSMADRQRLDEWGLDESDIEDDIYGDDDDL